MTLVSFATKLARFRERSARTTARKEKWRQARARKRTKARKRRYYKRRKAASREELRAVLALARALLRESEA